MRLSYNAPVILTFTFLSSALFAIDTYTSLHILSLCCISPSTLTWSDPFDYVRIFSYIVGHIDWNHLINNFLVILLIGPILEERHGSSRLLLMIAVTAGATALANAAMFDYQIMGASGIGFMLMGLASCTKMKDGAIPLTIALVLTLLVGKEIIASFNDDTTSQFGHIMGAFWGVFFGFTMQKT